VAQALRTIQPSIATEASSVVHEVGLHVDRRAGSAAAAEHLPLRGHAVAHRADHCRLGHVVELATVAVVRTTW
jgi:hypothetical protein